MYLIFEVLRLVSAVFGTASVVQTINKSPIYGHLVPIKEKQLRESFRKVLGQNGPWTKGTRQNGPRSRTKWTTSLDKTDQASGQKGPRFWTKRALF